MSSWMKVWVMALGLVMLPLLGIADEARIDAETGRTEYKAARDVAAMEALLRQKKSKGAGIRAQVVGNVDFQSFPSIKVFTVITDNAGDHKPGIPRSCFTVTETRQGSTKSVSSLSVTELGSGALSKADIVFVVDESGSMANEIEAVRQGIKNFSDLLVNSGIDCRLGIVSYEGTGAGGIGAGYSSGGFADSTQINTFKGWVDQIGTQGGTERAYDAIVFACSPPFEYRGDAQQIVCLVTDENNDTGKYTVQDAANSLSGKQFFFFNTDGGIDVDADFNPLGTKLGGAFNEQTLLNALGSAIVKKYMVKYTSPWSSADNVLRDVWITVKDPDNSLESAVASAQYTPAKSGTLTGRVTDQVSGNPIRGAVVQASGGSPATTDTAGGYSLSGLTAASGQSLVVNAKNYKPKIVRGINILAGNNPPVDVVLEPQAGDSAVLPLNAVNTLAGSTPKIEQGGSLLRWYRGTDARTGNQVRSDVEVSVFRRNLSTQSGWIEVVQGAPEQRAGTWLQKIKGHFPINAAIGTANVGDTVEFKVFYPPISAYSEAVNSVDNFKCKVIDRKYVHGFENKTDAELTLGVHAIAHLQAGMYAEDGRDLLYHKRSSAVSHDLLHLSKKQGIGVKAKYGASLPGASLRVNNHNYGAYAGASLNGKTGLFVRNDYEYAASDQTVSSAIAKLYLYFSPSKEAALLDPMVVQLLAFLGNALETDYIENPWIYSSSGVAGSLYGSAGATAGGFSKTHEIGGHIDVSAGFYGKLGIGELPRQGRSFSEMEFGTDESASVNLMMNKLTPAVGRGPEGMLLQNLGLATEANESVTIFARVVVMPETLKISFGHRTKAGAAYKASFYDLSAADSISMNNKLVSEFTISANEANLRAYLSSQDVLAGLLAGRDVIVTGDAVMDLMKAIIKADENPLLDVVYENKVGAYDEILANDVELSIHTGIGISGSAAGEFNRLTEFVSERGVWYGGELYVLEDYNADAKYHLTGKGSSVIPKNSINVSDMDDGPQDWIDTIGEPIKQAYTQLLANIKAGVKTVIQYGKSVITIGANAIGGAINQVSVTITSAIDWLNPFNKGATDGSFFGIGGFYMMEPDGELLQTPSTIEIAYTEEEITGWDESTLAVYRYDKASGLWVYVGGAVDTVNNKVIADITVLGTYTIAAAFPYDNIAVTLTPDSINADGVQTSVAQTDIILLNNGQTVSNGTLVNVETTLGIIQTADADATLAGTQLATTGGTVEFTIVAPEYGGKALLSVSTVQGLARGSAELEFVDTTPPDAPGSILASARETSIDVSWDPVQTADLAEYRIYYSEGIAGPPYDGKASVEGINSPVSISGAATNDTLRGLIKDRPYYITVVAVDASGNESDLPAAVSVRTSEGAPRPVPLVVVNNLQTGQGTAEVSWVPSPDDMQGAQDVVLYEIHRINTDTAQDIVLGSVDAGNLVYVDSVDNNPGNVIQSGVNYEYLIRTFDSSGNYSDSEKASLFVVGVILDVTDDVTKTPLGWELDRNTGALLATIRIENTAGKNGAPLRDAFWYAIQEGANTRLATVSGYTNGWAYFDVTAQVEAQLPSIGDGDMELDIGESVTFTVPIFTRDRSIPTGHIYGIWADPPVGGAKRHAFDANGDGILDDFEILGTVDAWKAGTMDDFGLLDAVELWRAGGYSWDETNGKFVPAK